MKKFTLITLSLILVNTTVNATFPNGFLFSSLISSTSPAPESIKGGGGTTATSIKDKTTTTKTTSINDPDPDIDQLNSASSLIDLLLDIANETDATPVTSVIKDQDEVDSDGTTDTSNVESITVSPDEQKYLSPKTVCIKSSSVVLFRYVQRKLRHLILTTLDFLALPLEALRDLLNVLLAAFTDGFFTLLGYHEPICRQQVLCRSMSFVVNILPNWLRSTFERNWQPIARLADRLDLLGSESELIEALVTGMIETNCTSIYIHQTCP